MATIAGNLALSVDSIANLGVCSARSGLRSLRHAHRPFLKYWQPWLAMHGRLAGWHGMAWYGSAGPLRIITKMDRRVAPIGMNYVRTPGDGNATLLPPKVRLCSTTVLPTRIRSADQTYHTTRARTSMRSHETRCSGKLRLSRYARREADETSPIAIFLQHANVRAHPEQTRSHRLFSQCSSAFVFSNTQRSRFKMH